MMRDDFCAFILTHGRPDKVYTYNTLKKAGYTGKVYVVIDDEDKTENEYREKFGDKVLQFCKKEIAERIDEGDNFQDRRAIIYARNACWDLARQVECKYFIQLDDDYTNFIVRHNFKLEYVSKIVKKRIDDFFNILIGYFSSISAITLCVSQGGDHIGGANSQPVPKLRRKAMNTFICDTEKQFYFVGKVNEDVNTYTSKSRSGNLFFTVIQAQVNQHATQSNSGGMTDLYLDSGTYIKTFYSVMYAPSCVQIGVMGDPRSPHYRIHHKINWHVTAPKILREEYKKAA